jgi:AmiR/NasT family two-component response regulator
MTSSPSIHSAAPAHSAAASRSAVPTHSTVPTHSAVPTRSAVVPIGAAANARAGKAGSTGAKNHAKLHLVTSRPRLLLAQDDVAAGPIDLAAMLEGAGFEVVGRAGDGGQAVAMTADLRPDAALLHAVAPANDGFRTASQIGRHATPVVMLARNSDPGLIKEALAAGVMAYVVEPFTQERVLPAIEMAVARHAEVTALRQEVIEISERLDARKVIERAKGLLMTTEKMTEPEAFRFIQRSAMDRRVSMRDVAAGLVDRLASK